MPAQLLTTADVIASVYGRLTATGHAEHVQAVTVRRADAEPARIIVVIDLAEPDPARRDQLLSDLVAWTDAQDVTAATAARVVARFTLAEAIPAGAGA